MAILLTNALSYTGPGVVKVISQTQHKLVVHDPAFANTDSATKFETSHPGTIALRSQTPAEIINELIQHKIEITALINNDVLGNSPKPIDQIPANDFQTAFDALFMFPVTLTQLLLPSLKSQQNSAIVFVTSARYLKPEAGFAVATSIRSATTSFAIALAHEVAPDGVQVNVVAPNFLYSETYYPKAKFVDDPKGREFIQNQVPMGRLGEPEEIGELINFLVSGKSQFVTGQVIDFTGGWPGSAN